MKPDTYDAILVDEANFLSSEQVEWLAEICDQYDIPVLCYGLKTDLPEGADSNKGIQVQTTPRFPIVSAFLIPSFLLL